MNKKKKQHVECDGVFIKVKSVYGYLRPSNTGVVAEKAIY